MIAYRKQPLKCMIEVLISPKTKGGSITQNGKGEPEHSQNSRNMKNNIAKQVRKWHGKMQLLGMMNASATQNV